ncbi:MAG: TonB-dependent receptor [Nitrospira sp.]|nr:TonB-dependent receptor [Nitrospira sp.]
MRDRKSANRSFGKQPGRIVLMVVALLVGGTLHALAQTESISGYVQYPDLRRGAHVPVTLRDQEGRRVASTVTSDAGEFVLVAPHPGTFSVQARRETSQSAAVVLVIGDDAPAPLVLTIKETEELALEIVAPRYPTNPKASGETYSVSRQDIESLPKGNNLDLNEVLAIIPSAANGGLKQVHIRQEHANLQFRIDGVPIPDTVTTQFTDLIHPRAWKRADIILGGMEAQYGNRTAAVIDITSKSGTKPGFGSIQGAGGSNQTVQPSFEYGGTVGNRFRWYVMNNYLATNRGIDPPTLGQSVYHNHGERNQTYLRGDYQLSNRHNLTWILLNSVASYQIPTQPGNTPNSDIVALLRAHTDSGFTPKPSEEIDENQDEHNQYSHLVWRYDMSANRFLSVAGYVRHSRATFKTDPYHVLAYASETDEPFSASHQDRWGVAGGVRIDYTHAINKRHVIKTGLQLDRTTTTNKTRLFAFERGGTDEEPVGAVLARHGDRQVIGYREEFWVQDQFTPHEQWTINAGVRVDNIHGYIEATQVSPRLGVTFALNDRHTFRAFYGRLFTPPNLEALPFQALNTAGTTAEAEDPTDNKVKPERSHAFEIGSIHAIGDFAVLQLAGYYKFNTNMTDAHQFNTTPMLNYFAYERGWQRGIEGTLRAKLSDRLTTQGNVAWGQCKGKGLQSGHFLLHEEELEDIQTSEGIFCDHMQTITSMAMVTYRLLEQTTISGQMLFGSGLRRHRHGAKTNSGHADSHTTYNLSVTHTIPLENQHKLLVGVDAINLLDQHEFVNVGEQSVGLGVSHTNMPRSIFFRAQWLF